MDPKAEIKNIGTKLGQEEQNTTNKDMTKELSNLNQITDTKADATITISQKDIDLLKAELEITTEEAKLMLIKYHGDLKKALEAFLSDFKFAAKQ